MGHDFRNDLKVLNLLDFDLRTSIVGILDTGKIVSIMLPNVPTMVSSVLSELQCPFQNLHTAGNDAYFTLLALLLLAIRSYTGEIVNDTNHRDILDRTKGNHTSFHTKRSDPRAKK